MRTRILILELILILVFVYQQPSGVLATAEKYFFHQEWPSFTDLYLICCQLSEISRSWVCYKRLELEHVIEAVGYWTSPTHTASNNSDLYWKTKDLHGSKTLETHLLCWILQNNFKSFSNISRPQQDWWHPLIIDTVLDQATVPGLIQESWETPWRETCPRWSWWAWQCQRM